MGIFWKAFFPFLILISASSDKKLNDSQQFAVLNDLLLLKTLVEMGYDAEMAVGFVHQAEQGRNDLRAENAIEWMEQQSVGYARKQRQREAYPEVGQGFKKEKINPKQNPKESSSFKQYPKVEEKYKKEDFRQKSLNGRLNRLRNAQEYYGNFDKMLDNFGLNEDPFFEFEKNDPLNAFGSEFASFDNFFGNERKNFKSGKYVGEKTGKKRRNFNQSAKKDLGNHSSARRDIEREGTFPVGKCQNETDWIDGENFTVEMEFVYTIEVKNSKGDETFFLCLSPNDVGYFYPNGSLKDDNLQLGYGPLPQFLKELNKYRLVA